MSFTPTEDYDTGEIFNGFTEAEAEFIVNLMSYGSNDFPDEMITTYIQLKHFFHPQEMIEELLAGREFTTYGRHESGVFERSIFYTSNMLFAVARKIHSGKFKDANLSTAIDAYETYIAIYDETEAEYEAKTITYDERQAIEKAALDAFEATLEEIMPEAGGGGSEEEIAKRNVYFDNKKRMMYIDGKYYNTIFIKRSTEE